MTRLRAAQGVNAVPDADATTTFPELLGGGLRRIGVLLVGLLLLASPAWAAPLNLNLAIFSWTAPAVDSTHGTPVTYTIKCGAATGGPYTLTFVVAAPTTSTLIRNVTPNPGTYFCILTASNATGESPPTLELMFQGVYPAPGSPTGFIAQ